MEEPRQRLFHSAIPVNSDDPPFQQINIDNSFIPSRQIIGFESVTPEGVRAHIQHLKGYASMRLNRHGQHVDPRYHILADLGYMGKVPTFDQLYVTWFPHNFEYGYRIDRILGGMYRLTNNWR